MVVVMLILVLMEAITRLLGAQAQKTLMMAVVARILGSNWIWVKEGMLNRSVQP